MAGDVRSSVAIDTRRFSPPLSPRVHSSPTKACATPSMPSDRMVSDTTDRIRAEVSAPPRPSPSPRIRSVAWNTRCSQTVEVPGNTSSWGTYPAKLRIAAASATAPLTRIEPPTTRFADGRPARMSSSVDLPAPEGPRIANRSARLSRRSLPKSPCPRAGPFRVVNAASSTPATPLTPRRIARPPTRSHVTSSQDSVCREIKGAETLVRLPRTSASASPGSPGPAPRAEFEDSSSMSVRAPRTPSSGNPARVSVVSRDVSSWEAPPSSTSRYDADVCAESSSSSSEVASFSKPPRGVSLAKPSRGAVSADRSRSPRDRRRDVVRDPSASPSRATARLPSQSSAARHGPPSAFRSIR